MWIRRNGSSRLVRLLFRWLLDLKFGGGFMNFTLKVVTSALELTQALTNSPGQLRKFFGPEKQQHDDENKNNFRPTRHGQGKQW